MVFTAIASVGNLGADFVSIQPDKNYGIFVHVLTFNIDQVIRNYIMALATLNHDKEVSAPSIGSHYIYESLVKYQ